MKTHKRIQIINDLTISVEKEDHTIMNPLKHMICVYKKDDVDFCGYTIPHPSENKVHITVQIKDQEKQNVQRVVSVVDEGIEMLKDVAKNILDKFSVEITESM